MVSVSKKRYFREVVGMVCTDLESGKAKTAANGSEMRYRFRSMVRLQTVTRGISTATAHLHFELSWSSKIRERLSIKSSASKRKNQRTLHLQISKKNESCPRIFAANCFFTRHKVLSAKFFVLLQNNHCVPSHEAPLYCRPLRDRKH